MKFALIFVAVLGLANAGLTDDWEGLKDIVRPHVPAIKAVIVNHAANNEEFQKVVSYVRSDEFKAIVAELRASPEYQKIISYLEDQGFDFTDLVEKIRELLGLNTFSDELLRVSLQNTLTQFWDDLKEVFPTDEVKAYIAEKRETSPEFQAFVETIKSSAFQEIVAAVRENEHWQNLLNRARAYGIDVDYWLTRLYDFFTWA